MAPKAICLVVAALLLPVGALSEDLLTLYEKSGRRATPRYAETVDYCKRLAGSSRWLRYTTFGRTPQGRELPLLIADKDGAFTPARLKRRDKAVLLIQAGIHAGEIDGKDAGLILLREIAVEKKYDELLDHVTILFIPIFNVDGHERFGPYNRINQNGPEEMGWRVTAQNLNLNRDYLKVDAPEMRAWIRLFNEWNPDFVVDCHVTDGADYQYVVTYLVEIFGNMAPGLTRWTRDSYLESVKRGMAGAGFDLSLYVFLLEWSNPLSGMRTWVSTPRFSTGYCALRNRPSLLIETHMLKDYETRVTGTYLMLKETIEFLNADYNNLKAAIEEADRFTASAEFRGEAYPLAFSHTDEYVMLDFKGIEFESVESDVSGGVWHRFNGEPKTFPIPYHAKQKVTASADLPEAYIIPPEWTDVIDRLAIHGIEFERLDDPVTLEVESYRFLNVTWQSRPYEGRHPAKFEIEKIRETRVFPAGSVLIDMAQNGARVVAHILEPEGPDSYVQWGFFDGIFEQKEYASSWVMEGVAREMLESDADLRHEFEDKKANDPDFAGNPQRILNWFYKRSPYWDDRKDVYPVGKIFDAEAVDSLYRE